MKRHLIPVLLGLLFGAVSHAQQRIPVLAIVGARIVNVTGDSGISPPSTIIIRDGVILEVGAVASVRVPRGARRVDARGQFAIPGLWDSHVHFMNTGPSALPLYVAHGVTSVREMGGYLDSTRAWQRRMRAGTLVGPRILTPGPMLESPRYLQNVRDRSVRDPRIGQRVLPYRIGVGDSADARKAIDSLKTLGVDFVKIRTVATPAAYFAILREAHRVGLRVAGHLPGVVNARVAADSGQDDIEHAIGPLLSRESEPVRDSVYDTFLRRNTWYTPTLVVTRAVGYSGDSAHALIFGQTALRSDERRRYASPWLLGWWEMQVRERLLDTSLTRAREMAESYQSSAADVRALRGRGVRILAGSDAGSVLVYPGFSLHEELQLLVDDGGLSPREALWSATIGPAQFARLDDSLGVIGRGRIADIVLLEANPLVNIRNTRRIRAVVQRGEMFSRRELDGMFTAVRRQASQ